MLNVKEVKCFLGKALSVDDGKTEITVTLDVGPRIIGLKPVGGFDMMFHDVNDSVNHDCSAYYGRNKKWHIYGGHRIWLSPEDETTYYPDNDAVSYIIENNTVTFTPPIWKKVNVSPSLSITFNNGTLTIENSIKNLGKKRPLCIWALTVMKSGGTLTLPLSTEDTGYLANRNLVIWHYASLQDERLTLCDDKIILNSSVSVSKPYKLGTYCDDINASYELTIDGVTQTFTKRTKGVKGANYPDFTCNFETYCSDLIHELETLSPIVEVKKNETLTLTEIWTVK